MRPIKYLVDKDLSGGESISTGIFVIINITKELFVIFSTTRSRRVW